MAAKQKDKKGPDNMAAGSSDAEFEKLLAEVRCTLSLLLAYLSLGHQFYRENEACWHALTCIVLQPFHQHQHTYFYRRLSLHVATILCNAKAFCRRCCGSIIAVESISRGSMRRNFPWSCFTVRSMHVAQVWRTEVRLEILLRTLGLSSAANTLIGDAVVRGVSGGERKRVTSAEMLVGPKASPHAQSSFSRDICH